MTSSSPSSSCVRFVVPALLVAGCLDEAERAELLLPEQVVVAWEVAYDGEDDGKGALVPVDLMAFHSTTGQALPGIPLTVWAEAGAAWPVAANEIVVVDPDDCYGCELLWDAERDEFLHAPQVTDVLTLTTDADGLARLYVYVDSFPPGSEGRAFDELLVSVAMGDEEQSFPLLAR